MRRAYLIIIVAVCCTSPSRAWGQRARPELHRFEPAGLTWANHSRALHAGFGRSAPDHRWEGLVVGAVAVGAFGGWAMHGLCGVQDTPHHCFWPTVYGIAGGALVGGVTGGFIGRLFPKAPRDSTPPEP